MTVIGLLLAALTGIALGLLGGGGAILAVPIFNYVLGFGAKEAIASSLAVVGVTSLSGVASHWREGNVKLRIALTFGLPAAAGAFLGAKVLAGAGLVRPPGAPLHPWWGLFQWVLLAVWFPCTVVLALRLLRVARAADAPR